MSDEENSTAMSATAKKRRRRPDLTGKEGPITEEGAMPKKAYYRARAHVNPLSHNNAFVYPATPNDVEWAAFFPPSTEANGGEKRTGEASEKGAAAESAAAKIPDHPTIVDVGCGFGGLTVALAQLYPQERSLGMEIRAKVCEYVRLRIEALRVSHPGLYLNAAVLRTNSMRYVPNYFAKGSLKKLFFCFPDPHFKAKNHRRRIVTTPLLAEYAYALEEKGRLYCITDVEDLHQWHVKHCDAHPAFRKLGSSDEPDSHGGLIEPGGPMEDPAVACMIDETEEGKKVARAGNAKYWVVYERLPNDQVPKALLFPPPSTD